MVFLLAAALSAVSCGVTDKKNDELHRLDIADAGTLFIASNHLAKRTTANEQTGGLMNTAASSGGATLFKITDDGYIEEVTYFDEDGNEISYTLFPSDIFNVNHDYLIVVFGEGTTGYLVRKSDGAVFTLMEVGTPYKGFGGYRNWPPVHSDTQNNAYYITFDDLGQDMRIHHVLRINLDNPARLTAQIISPTEEDVGFFYVNANGDVLYDGLNITPRIILSDGGLVNTPPFISDFWIGGDKQFYGNEFRQHGLFQIKKLVIADRELVIENYGEGSDIWFQTDRSTILNLQEKVYLVFEGDQGGEVIEVYNPQSNPKRVDGLGMHSIRNAVASDQYYYLSGTDDANRPTLMKVEAQINTPVSLLPPGGYDIYTMTVSQQDVLTFSALRMQDGKRVIGEIGPDGSITILDEELEADIIVLERIN